MSNVVYSFFDSHSNFKKVSCNFPLVQLCSNNAFIFSGLVLKFNVLQTLSRVNWFSSVLQIDAHVGGVNDLAFSHPNKQLCVITCGDDKTIKVHSQSIVRIWISARDGKYCVPLFIKL